MTISLEELKRQREQIQKHLEWLDAKIGDLEKSPKDVETRVPPVDGRASEAAAETPRLLSVDQPVSEAGPLKSDPIALEILSDAPSYQSSTGSEIMRAKFGCLLLFIAGIALFLFLLFGLPFL
jgi:hypothetical protein